MSRTGASLPALGARHSALGTRPITALGARQSADYGTRRSARPAQVPPNLALGLAVSGL